jgi:hypothetical protein
MITNGACDRSFVSTTSSRSVDDLITSASPSKVGVADSRRSGTRWEGRASTMGWYGIGTCTRTVPRRPYDRTTISGIERA